MCFIMYFNNSHLCVSVLSMKADTHLHPVAQYKCNQSREREGERALQGDEVMYLA